MQNPEAPYKNAENLDQKPNNKPPKSPAGIIQTLIATKDIIDGYIEDWEMREYAWNSNDPKYNDFPIDPGAFPSGTIDEGVMAVTDIIESVKLAKDLITNKDNIRSQMWEAITNVSIPDDIWNMVSDWFSEKADKYAEGGDMAEYTAGRDVAAIALIFFDPSSGLGKLLTKVLGKLKKVGSVITDKMNDTLKKVILRTEKGKGPELKRDLDTNPELKKLFDESSDPETLYKAWDVLDDAGYSRLRKTPASLEKVVKLLTNPKLSDAGLDEDVLRRMIKGNNGRSGAALDDLTQGLDELVEAGTKFEDVGKLINDLENPAGGFAEGARFVQKAIAENTEEFAGKTLKFEETLRAGENLRRVDVRVKNEGLKDIFYEFKSVSNIKIPPDNFAKQFVNDMNLDEVIDLDQLKWVFDGKKVSNLDDYVDDFMNALIEADIPPSTINKLVTDIATPSKNDLINLIGSKFDEIFQVK